MWVIFKIFLTISSALILGFLILSSFIIEQYISSEQNSILLDSLEIDITTLTGGVNHKRFSYLDEVYYSSWQLNERKEWNIVNIDLEPWEYIFSLSGLGLEYVINYRGFSVKNMWPWIFYINTLNNRKNSILSLSSTLNLELIDISDNSISTNVYIYPHGFMMFDTERNDDLIGGDSLRVFSFQSSLIQSSKNWKFYRDLWYMKENFWYFNKSILDISGNLESDFIEKFSKFSDNKIFISEVLSVIYQNNKILHTNIVKVRELKKSIISWEKYLEKFDWIFFNIEKRNSFLKSRIFNDLNTLFSKKEKDLKLVSKLSQNIKKINWKNDQKIQRVLNNYYKYISIEWDRNTKYNFYKLYEELSKNKVNFTPSLFYLKDIYNSYDFAWNDKLYSNISLFNRQYFSELWISLWSKKLTIKEDNFRLLWYFSHFLQKLLVEHDSFDKDTILKVIYIFDNYVLLDNNLYWGQSEKMIATWVKNHLDILINISKAMKVYYFEDNRDDLWLLLKKKIQINSNNIEILEDNIDNLIAFFNKNRYIYEEWNIYIKDYDKIEKEFEEYFSALLDYENYKSKNSGTNSFINEVVVSIEELSVEKASNLLMYFENVNIDNVEIKVVNNDFYTISNLKIDWKIINFNLYPTDDNTIDEIYVDTVNWNWNYILWSKISEEWVESPSGKKDYLYEVFSDTNKTDQEDIKKEYKLELSLKTTNEIAFIRDYLIGKRWDFYKLAWILEMWMDNISAVNSGGWVISIKKAFFTTVTIDLENDEVYKYSSLFSSDYFKSDEKSYFDNISLKLLDWNYSYWEKNNDLYYLLFWKEINLIWRIQLDAIEDTSFKIWKALNDIVIIWGYVNNILFVQDIDISYNISRKKILMKFDYLWDKVTLSSVDWKLDYIFYKWKNILDSKIELDKLEENLINLQ